MGRRVRTPQPLSLVRNSWKRAVKPCCTTRLWQVILLHEHAWLHSNNIGGSAKHNKVTKNSLTCILSKNSLTVSEMTAQWATCIQFPARVSFLLLCPGSYLLLCRQDCLPIHSISVKRVCLTSRPKNVMYNCLKSLLCRHHVCAEVSRLSWQVLIRS